MSVRSDLLLAAGRQEEGEACLCQAIEVARAGKAPARSDCAPLWGLPAFGVIKDGEVRLAIFLLPSMAGSPRGSIRMISCPQPFGGPRP
jgi:hypothetical protein